MLHITNGDIAAEKIREAGVPGLVLPWRDVLNEGPVPQGLDDAALRRERARFIASRGWAEYEDVLADLEGRDETLRRASPEEELVLWFEHDLYDQLQLLQVIVQLAQRRPAGENVSLVLIDRFHGIDRFLGLGQLSPTQLGSLLPTRTPLTLEQIGLAIEAWAAFRSPDPLAIDRLMDDPLEPLPFLRPALLRHLQEFPGTADGLSRTERQILSTLSAGPATARDLFAAAQAQEEAPFLGDVSFWWTLEDLGTGESRLVQRIGGADVPHPAATDLDNFADLVIEIDDAGRAVLDGRKDRVALRGIDRWLGGVHLQGRGVGWRWDERRLRLRATG